MPERKPLRHPLSLPLPLCLLAVTPGLAVDGAIFTSAGVFGSGSYADTGDFNGDGVLDLAGVNPQALSAAVMLGNGDGTFGAEILIPLGTNPFAAGVGDFNNDTFDDLAVSTSVPAIILGNGDGTFQAPIFLPAGTGSPAPRMILVEDLNGDGTDDFVISDRLTYELVTHLGNGDGTFQAPLRPNSWCRPHGVAAADLNEDGILDLAVGSDGCFELSLHLGAGDGRFALDAVVGTQNGVPAMPALGDLDRDGHLDAATPAALTFGGGANVLLGAGDGSFPALETTAGLGSWAAAIEDFDGDGNPDLILTRDSLGFGSDGVDLFLGGGGGAMTPEGPVLESLGTELPVIADFDNDGLPDLAISGWGFGSSGVRILINQGPFAGACVDSDGDGYGSPGEPSCPGGGAADCSDGNSGIHPGAGEICDSLDNDCDTIADDGFDVDADGFSTCGGGDCDDSDPAVFPGAGELCNLIDDDCDGSVDENPDALDSCDDLYPCTVDSCDPDAACTHDAAACPGAAVAATLFDSAVLGSGEQGTVIAGGDLDEDGVGDLAIGTDYGLLLRFGAGDGTFSSERRILTEPPRGIVVADLDGDDHLDLAATHDGVTVFLGAGDGTFGAASFFPAGAFPTAVVAGSFDAGGIVDLAVTNPGASTVSILPGDGIGGFGPPQPFPAGDFPRDLAAGHLNGDASLDLLVANTSTDSLTVLLGAGDGTFGPAQTAAILGHAPTAVAIADFTGDGDGDAAAACIGSDEVSILPGNGDGTFGAEILTSVGDAPSALATTELNGDGLVDLIVAERGSDRLVILLGQGNGGFNRGDVVATGNDPVDFVLTDLGGGPALDLAAAGRESFLTGGTLTVALGEGGGEFSGPASFAVGDAPASVTVGDFNGDGAADLAVPNQGIPCAGTAGDVSILLGAGDGTFGPESRVPAGLEPSGAAAGDFDDDGRIDLAVANRGCIGQGQAGGISILLGAGDGTFADGGSFPAGDGPAGLSLGDLDRDGALDLIVVDEEGDQTVLFLGNGDGTFTAGDTLAEGGRGAAVADMNGDLTPDIVVDAPVGYLPGNGDGTFGALVPLPFSFVRAIVAVGDFDGDGNPDAAGGSQIALGNGDGTFAPAIRSGAGRVEGSLVAADFNLDGFLDLAATMAVLSGTFNRIWVELGAGDGTLGPATGFAAGGATEPVDFPSSPLKLAAGDFDGDGRTDVAVANKGLDTVTVSLNRGPTSGCLDGDGDGFGAPGNPACAGGLAPDCDDLDPSRFPGALELCDGLDNDCDLRIDEGPDEVADLRVLQPGPTTARLEWDAQPAADFYELHLGSIGGYYDHIPSACRILDTFFIEPSSLPIGFGFYYLVRGGNACGLGTLGAGTNGKRPVLIECS